jgi:deoxyribodipyrimidine photo-lyase
VLHTYEHHRGANDSTYWIYFELLWREYYQFYAHRHGKKLFSFSGLKLAKPATSFYPERFQKWCNGNTPYPIVNAFMKQLNSTGYMSNRGRQLVASCFVHELGLNWRYGASYMEQQLVDYDVASNWGNWQYLAGVGADPRGHRRFNLTKQTQIYDPKGDFIKKWGGDNYDSQLDSVDAADWPISWS